MANKECGIRQTGDIRLEGGQLVFFNRRGDRVGRMLLGGPDGETLFIDGVEVTLCQEGDPTKLRFASRYSGAWRGASGGFSWNILRDGSDIQDEIAFFIGGLAEDVQPGELKGQVQMSIRPGRDITGDRDDLDEPRICQVWTSAYSQEMWGVRRMYTAVSGFLDNLWKFA